MLGWQASVRCLMEAWVLGVGCGDVYGWPCFSRASKILFGDMKCSSFRWLFWRILHKCSIFLLC